MTKNVSQFNKKITAVVIAGFLVTAIIFAVYFSSPSKNVNPPAGVPGEGGDLQSIIAAHPELSVDATSTTSVSGPKSDGGSYAKILLSKLAEGDVSSAEDCVSAVKNYKAPEHTSLGLSLFVPDRKRCLGLRPEGVFDEIKKLSGHADAIVDVVSGKIVVQCIDTLEKNVPIKVVCKDGEGSIIPTESVWQIGSDTWNSLEKLVQNR
jgi:hypothetical protein